MQYPQKETRVLLLEEKRMDAGWPEAANVHYSLQFGLLSHYFFLMQINIDLVLFLLYVFDRIY